LEILAKRTEKRFKNVAVPNECSEESGLSKLGGMLERKISWDSRNPRDINSAHGHHVETGKVI
jgi:hypothetical protein